MQTLATTEKSKSTPATGMSKNQQQPFFAPVRVQPRLAIGAVDDPYEREADAMADRVMRMPATGAHQTFFKPAPTIIQRQDDTTKTLTEGASVVKDLLEDKPGFEEWKDKQTDALKKKVWDDQPTEFKAGIIGFGLSSAGILGSVIASDPGFRSDTIKLLDDKNIALPLSLIPYHEYFPLSSFKYKLPSTTGAPLGLSAEFEFKPYLDLMHEKWSFIPKADLTLGVDTSYSNSSGLGIKGGSIKLKFGSGIFNFTGVFNQTLPATPMLVSGNNPGESPMWIMRTLPGQFDDQLPKGYAVYLSVDIARVPEFLKGDDRKTDVKRKCAKCEEEEKLHRKETSAAKTVSTSLVEQTLESSGSALDKNTRSFMEQRFGYDFGKVKIHTNPLAAKSAGSINALAYTSGNNIVFNQNQFSPGTEGGKRLLAHELTHVVQQGNNLSRKSFIQKQDTGLLGPIIASIFLDKQELENHIKNNNWGGAYTVLNRQWMKFMVSTFLDSLPVNSISDLISNADIANKTSAVGDGGKDRILAALYAVKAAKDSGTSDSEIETGSKKAITVNFDQRMEIRAYLVKYKSSSQAAKKLYDILSKPFLGDIGTAYDFSDRFLKYSDKLGFDLEASTKSLHAYKSSPYTDPQPVSITNEATKSFENSDILFFSGHQYAQYRRPGIFTNDSSEYCFNLGAISKKLNKVKLVVSTSCATICKDTARIFNDKFPNALILGYRLSAPLNGGILSKAFADTLEKEGPIDLSTPSGINTVKKVWKSVTMSAGGKEGQPGLLFGGQVEFWNGAKWQTDSEDSKVNECHYH